MLTKSPLRDFIEAHAIACELIELPTAGDSVAAAASALGVSSQAIVKSVLFMANDTPLLAIATGETRIDVRNLAAALDISKKRVRLATPVQTLASTGYPVGGVPPFGHPTPLQTFIDSAVRQQQWVYAGAGGPRLVMRISTVDLIQITSGTVTSLA